MSASSEDRAARDLRGAVDRAPIAVFGLDANGIIFLSEGGARLSEKYTPHELLGRSAFELFEASPKVLATMRRALVGETVVAEAEHRGLCWDIQFTPLLESGRVTGLLGVASDCAPRKHALEFLDAVVENIPNMIFVKEAENLRFVRFNRAGEELLGYSRGELIGKTDYDFFPKEEADFFTAKDRIVLAEGRLVEITAEPIHTRAKGTRLLFTKKIPIRDERGRLYLLGISEDITERRQIEAERQRLYERSRELEERNARLITNVGHELRRPISELQSLGTHVEKKSDADRLGQQTRALTTLVDGLVEACKPEANLDEAVRVPPAAPGRPLVLVVDDDLRLNGILVKTLSRDYRVQSAFDGAQGLKQALALEPDLILTDLVMPGMGGAELLAAIRKHRSLADTPVVVLTGQLDERLRIDLLQHGAQDYLEKPFTTDELTARVGNLISMKRARDLLQRELSSKQYDLEALARGLVQRSRELEIAHESMRLAREQAEQASRMKSEFIALVSHELRTPAAALRLRLDQLERSPSTPLTSERVQQSVSGIVRAAERLFTLVDSLLDYAQVESGKIHVSNETFDLAALAAEAVDASWPGARARGIDVRLSSPPPLPKIESDRRLVRLVLGNLIGNAVKYTEKGEVVVTLEAKDDIQRIAVRDTGPGIPKEKHASIFEAFHQLGPVSNKHHTGVGLGLAIVNQTIRALGGFITLESQVGVGSTFVVTLPTHPPPVQTYPPGLEASP